MARDDNERLFNGSAAYQLYSDFESTAAPEIQHPDLPQERPRHKKVRRVNPNWCASAVKSTSSQLRRFNSRESARISCGMACSRSVSASFAVSGIARQTRTISAQHSASISSTTPGSGACGSRWRICAMRSESSGVIVILQGGESRRSPHSSIAFSSRGL